MSSRDVFIKMPGQIVEVGAVPEGRWFLSNHQGLGNRIGRRVPLDVRTRLKLQPLEAGYVWVMVIGEYGPEKMRSDEPVIRCRHVSVKPDMLMRHEGDGDG